MSNASDLNDIRARLDAARGYMRAALENDDRFGVMQFQWRVDGLEREHTAALERNRARHKTSRRLDNGHQPGEH